MRTLSFVFCPTKLLVKFCNYFKICTTIEMYENIFEHKKIYRDGTKKYEI